MPDDTNSNDAAATVEAADLETGEPAAGKQHPWDTGPPEMVEVAHPETGEPVLIPRDPDERHEWARQAAETN